MRQFFSKSLNQSNENEIVNFFDRVEYLDVNYVINAGLLVRNVDKILTIYNKNNIKNNAQEYSTYLNNIIYNIIFKNSIQ